MARTRGPSGSVRGVPEEEATRIILKVVKKLAKNGATFTRAEARDLFEKECGDGHLADGFIFSLQRTVPGIRNVGWGEYALPDDWAVATKNRMWRYRSPPLDVLQATELLELLQNGDAVCLADLAADLRHELGSIR